MATRERTRRPQQGQLDLGEDFIPAVAPQVAGDDEDLLQQHLEQVAAAAEDNFVDRDAAAWATSPYGWVKRLPTVTRGKAATSLVSALLTDAGIPVTARTHPDHDLVVAGHRARIKLSTRWASGEYTFQQIRPGSYDVLLLLGLSPHTAHLWCVPRETALAQIDAAGSDAAWVAFTPAHAPAWLAEHGGPLSAALHAIRTLPSPR